MTLVKQASAVVGLVSAVVGLVLVAVSQLGHGDPEPTPVQSARFGAVALDPGATQRQYLDRTNRSKLGFTPAQLARRGAFVQVQTRIVGYRGVAVPIRREVIDATTGDEVGQLRAETVTPPADEVSAPWPDWIPLRPGKGRYIVVITLLNPRSSNAIACAQSEPFGGLDGLEPGGSIPICPSPDG